MPLIPCRSCHDEIMAESEKCPKCGCQPPFACAVCGTHLGAVTVIGWAHPFTAEGQPLCTQHTQRLCEHCGKPCPPETLTPRIVRWETLPHAPEPVAFPGMFCPACSAAHQEPPRPAAKARRGCLLGLLGL